ncbi:MAG: ATP-binding protein [Phycisphaerae bacterium]
MRAGPYSQSTWSDNRCTTRRMPRILAGCCVLGALACFALSLYVLLRPLSPEEVGAGRAMSALHDLGERYCRDVARVVRPAIVRARKAAADPVVVAALRGGDAEARAAACNRVITGATEIDAIALFDTQGQIVAINTVYSDGRPVEPARVDRVLRMSFDDRDIVQHCIRNNAVNEALEFQTQCDITPAFFDSSGLSVAYSLPVRDTRDGARLGVASVRLRFERLSELLADQTLGDARATIEFITDRGEYFSEDVNQARVAPPVPVAALAALVVPLVRGETPCSLAEVGDQYVSVFRLREFTTIDGGGIQVMLALDESWLAAEARQRAAATAGAAGAAGVLFALLAALARAYHATRAAAARVRLLIDTALSAIITTDPAGHITDWNPEAKHIFGYSAEEALGRPITELLAPVDASAFSLDAARETRRRVETQVRRKDGTSILIELSVTPLHADGPAQVSVFARDVTERERMQRQLLHSQKMESIGALAAGIAHEINTPTQYVSDNTRFLHENFVHFVRLFREYEQAIADPSWSERGAELSRRLTELRRELDIEFLSAEFPKAIAQSLEGLDRITTIVRAMKGFSHPDGDTKELADLNSAIQSTVTVSRARWKDVAQLELRLDPELPRVPVHLGEFNQVVLNLVVNAADAIGEKLASTGDLGRITVTTRVEDGHAVIEVADDGPGIPAAIRERIFDPFFTTKEVGKGTGQGLSICHAAIVKHHDGALHFTSTVGEGTTFYIRLPLAPARPAAPISEGTDECPMSA